MGGKFMYCGVKIISESSNKVNSEYLELEYEDRDVREWTFLSGILLQRTINPCASCFCLSM